MKTRHLLIASVVVALAILEFGVFKGFSLSDGSPPPGAAGGVVANQAAATSEPPPPPFDVKPLLRPAKKYVGFALPGDPTATATVTKLSGLIGKQPNLLTIYESFADDFAASKVREAYRQGALGMIRWEPFDAKLKDIAAGKQDPYVTKFATAVRTLNLPIALTFAHEMNGNWYPWGHSKNTPADFVAAWRHVHDVFAKVGATNVIWTWTANVINPVPSVKLRPLYPGDKYVDWLGMDGYFTHKGAHTYPTLFGPTMKAIRKFTKKPFLIVETGTESGSNRSGWLRSLIRGVATDPNMVGFVYFDQNGSGNWRIDGDSSAVSAFRRAVGVATIGFTVK